MRIAIVGGGIAGLAAAWFLRDHDVTVLEGAERIGGKLWTRRVAGIPVDVGAEALLNRRPEAVELAREVGLGDVLTHPETTTAGLWVGGEHRPIPAGTVMGIPTDMDALAEAKVLTDAELDRVAADLERPGEPVRDDVSIGRYAAERLGRRLVDRVVEPLLGGVYAGHADRLSLEATVPALLPPLAHDPSLIRAARVAQAARAEAAKVGATPSSPAPPAFAGLAGGVGGLPGAVAAASGAEIRTGAMVRELARVPAARVPGAGTPRWHVTVGPTRAPERLEADAVVLACPARPAGRLLEPVVASRSVEEAGAVGPDGLAGLEYASMATIVLAYPEGAAPPGSGFLVPPGEGRTVKAATYASSKWGWLADASAGRTVVRCSIGRYGEEAVLQRPDAELIAAARADLAEATGITAEPLDAVLTRWGGGLPQYEVGHTDLVARAREAVATLDGLAVAGAAYDGVGVPACVASARAAADQIRRTVG